MKSQVFFIVLVKEKLVLVNWKTYSNKNETEIIRDHIEYLKYLIS